MTDSITMLFSVPSTRAVHRSHCF